MYGNLFVRSDHEENLEAFAARAFKCLNVAGQSARDSDNYAEGTYVVGHALGFVVKVAIADDSEFPDYQFWINFKPSKAWVEDPQALDGLADVAAKQLALDGYQVARALAFGRIGGAKVLYSRKTAAGTARDQLEIRRVDKS